MKNKVVRDWIAVTICPLLLWITSYYVYGFFSNSSYSISSATLWYFYSFCPHLFLMISAIVMARTVNLSASVYESPWIFPVLLIPLIPTVILLLYPTGIVSHSMFLLTNIRMSFLLAGTSIYNIIKACYLQRKKRCSQKTE